MKVIHLCLACFYIDNYSYQENALPKYHKIMGHEVVVIASLMSFDKNGNICFLKTPEEYICRDDYKVIRLNYKKRFKFFNKILKRYEKTYSSIEREKPDLIFIHGCQFWDIKQVVKYRKRHQNVKIFIDNHSDFNNSANYWISKKILHEIIWRYCAKLIEPFADKFYGVTPLRCDFLKKVYKISAGNIELLVLGADDEKINFKNKEQIRQNIRKKNNISENDFVIVTGGKIDPEKNIHLLLQAVIELGNDNIKLILFGTSNQQMRPIINDLSKSSCIRNIGWIDSDQTYDYFLASDLAVFPGTHSVLWEQSVGTGIPGVFKYWEGMDHVDLGGNCKFIYEVNISEIKRVLKEIISNQSEYQKMKRVAVEEGIKKFSYKEISRKAIQF
jgi:glycosyltransferase involved in cell wall biosynthesis